MDGYSEVDTVILPVIVPPVVANAPILLLAVAAVDAPVPPCTIPSGSESTIGQPNDTVSSSPAAIPKPTAFPPFLMCIMYAADDISPVYVDTVPTVSVYVSTTEYVASTAKFPLPIIAPAPLANDALVE